MLALVLSTPVLAGCLGSTFTESAEAGNPRTAAGHASRISVFPGSYRFDGSYSYTLASGIHASRPVELVEIPSRVADTTPNGRISMGVWRPDVPEGTKVPVIVTAGPSFDALWDTPVDKPSTRLGAFLLENFVPHGYAVVQLAVRGTGNHGGCMDYMGIAEQADLSTAIDWLGTQSWSNGNVGMIGRAYDGTTPWEVAAQGNRYLKTIVPNSGISDLYDLLYRNGTSETRAPGVLHAVYYAFGFVSPGRSAENIAANLLCPEVVRGLASATFSTVVGGRGPAANDFFRVRDFERLARQRWPGSVFLVQGFQNWDIEPHTGAPLADELEREGHRVKQLWGQWSYAFPDRARDHASTACGAAATRWDWAEILLHWFDRELKDLSMVETGPGAQVMDSVTCRWRNEDHFPPRDASWAMYHLSAGNGLVVDRPSTGSVNLLPNPEKQAGCVPPPALTVCHSAEFVSEPFAQEVIVSGLPRVHVTVTPHSPTGSLAAFLYLLNETNRGNPLLIGQTQMNLLNAGGGEEPEPFVPGQDLLMKMQLEPMDAVIPAGARVMLRVWQAPYEDHFPGPPAPVTLKFGTVKSVVELPLVERKPDAFFTPPRP